MTGLDDIARVSSARSRSISAENPTGAVSGGGLATTGTGAVGARDLGVGWKVSPSLPLPAGARLTLADIEGPGVIRHLWMTCPADTWRRIVLRVWWDDEPDPSIETPLGDFFANGWGARSRIESIPIAALAGGGLNSYWPMPFRRRARLELENRGDAVEQFFFQIDYSLEEVPDDAAYLHAQWRRSDPVEGGVHVLVDGISGRGHYVGTTLAWEAREPGWWGEGEVKFRIDGEEHPTINGTGVEDYVGGAWGFEDVPGAGPTDMTSAYLGFCTVGAVRTDDDPDPTPRRFGMYRWHLPDPIRFETGLHVTVQALGLGDGGAGPWRVLRDDVASLALWYQVEPHAPFPELPALRD